MTQHELDQIAIFEKLGTKEISQATAARLLNLSIRQIQRKLKGYRVQGAASLSHQARGRPSNNRITQGVKNQVALLIQEKYSDFGPTLAAEKLQELHGIVLSNESVRTIMREAHLWHPKKQRQKEVHVWRERRACRGELVQLDGSSHAWFEGRGEKCCLLAFIDDANSELLWAEFVVSESTNSLLVATQHYLESVGRPMNLYTDRGGVYKVNIHTAEGDHETQYQRALKELDIGLIHARSPQAKGRVERLFGTLQNRLVKELRLKSIATMPEANHYLQEEYLCLHNTKFAVLPRENSNLHRSLSGFDLAATLCTKETRILQPDWCISYQNRWLQVTPKQRVILTKKEKVTVSHYLDGSLHLAVKGVSLSFTELTQRPRVALREKQLNPGYRGYTPALSHPWKRYYPYPKHDISTLVKSDNSTLV